MSKVKSKPKLLVSEPVTPRAEAAAPVGKLDRMVALLNTPRGASIAELAAATGWQSHSVRGALAGALKKGRGLSIHSEKGPNGRTYRIQAEVKA